MKGRLFWKLFLGNAALMAVVLTTCVWLLLGEFSRFHSDELAPYLKGLASTAGPLVESRLRASNGSELQALAKELGASVSGGVRFTFLTPGGTVVGDSHADPASTESHADRPEIKQALAEGWGESTRWSTTVSRDLRYAALRLGPAESPTGIVRVAIPLRSIAERGQSIRRLGWGIGLAALVAAIVLALGLAMLWSRRISRLNAAARSLSRGDLTARVDAAGADEVALLGRSINRMRDRLAGQLSAMDRHRRTFEMLIGQLGEGVVVVGPNGRILLMNPAARRLFNLPSADGEGIRDREAMSVEQCVPHHDLQEMLLVEPFHDPAAEEAPDSASIESVTARNDGESAMRELRLDLPGRNGEVTVLARVSSIALPEVDGPREKGSGETVRTGRLLVLTDITELTRTIKVKTDFVANASHELRTPVAAIRAALETLLKLELPREVELARKFLEVIGRHSHRLEALAVDLLALSRVESPAGRFEPSMLRLTAACDDLYERWRDALDAKGLRWRCDVPGDRYTVFANAYLLELVLDNLVENAIKFTERGGQVSVVWHYDDGPYRVEVSDTGCGIAAAEQERVFERFYQAPLPKTGGSGKSAQARGTGLGLSIVRHAVAAMGGRAHLSSVVGHGTQVSFTIPQPQRSIPAAKT